MRRALFLLALALILAGCGGAASVGSEPASAHTFVTAIAAGNPTAMRSVESQACVNDSISNYCFAPSSDASFLAWVQQAHPRFTFVDTAISSGRTVVTYLLTDQQGTSVWGIILDGAGRVLVTP